jgi:hypothetical protein
MSKSPFHFGLFHSACVGLLGRRESEGINYGLDGFYDWLWIAQSDEEKATFVAAVPILRKWLDQFDVTWTTDQGFLATRIEYGSWNQYPDTLRIIITHPVRARADDVAAE